MADSPRQAELMLCFALGKTPAELRSYCSVDDLRDLLAYVSIYGTPLARIEHAAVVGLAATASSFSGKSIDPHRIAFPTDRPRKSPEELGMILNALAGVTPKK